MCQFQQPIGQGRFAVVDMGYDAKITDVFHYGRKNKKKIPSKTPWIKKIISNFAV
jgi:hypothetical protein